MNPSGVVGEIDHLTCGKKDVYLNGTWFMYYKGIRHGVPTENGVATADNLTGPYRKYEGNPLMKGHGHFCWRYKRWLICPRPFMVERGHHDGVAPGEWVAYEYAKTRRRYDLLGIGDRTEMEVFNGPHSIHGEGTYAFLHRHLGWP